MSAWADWYSYEPIRRGSVFRLMRSVTAKSCRNPSFCNLVIQLYVDQDLPIRAVCRATGVSQDTVYRILHRAGVQTRDKEPQGKRNPARVDFFQTIDTEEKAYFLGLWCADGCTTELRKGGHASRISLTESDSAILDRLNTLLFPDGHQLYRSEGYTDTRNDGRVFAVKASRTICVYGREFSENLQRNGCTQRKTFTLDFPNRSQVPSHLLHHFVRGYFDGDGSIGVYPTIPRSGGYQYPAVCIISSWPFTNGLQAHLYSIGINSSVKAKGRVSTLHITSISGCRNFMRYMYEDSTVWLARKRDKFEAYFSAREALVNV